MVVWQLLLVLRYLVGVLKLVLLHNLILNRILIVLVRHQLWLLILLVLLLILGLLVKWIVHWLHNNLVVIRDLLSVYILISYLISILLNRFRFLFLFLEKSLILISFFLLDLLLLFNKFTITVKSLDIQLGLFLLCRLTLMDLS